MVFIFYVFEEAYQQRWANSDGWIRHQRSLSVNTVVAPLVPCPFEPCAMASNQTIAIDAALPPKNLDLRRLWSDYKFAQVFLLFVFFAFLLFRTRRLSQRPGISHF